MTKILPTLLISACVILSGLLLWSFSFQQRSEARYKSQIAKLQKIPSEPVGIEQRYKEEQARHEKESAARKAEHERFLAERQTATQKCKEEKGYPTMTWSGRVLCLHKSVVKWEQEFEWAD